MRIACLGDSITYGHGLPDLRERWTDLAARQTGHEFINCGLSGDTTAGMLIRCHEEVFPLSPDRVVLLGGTNDINTTGECRSACANMVSLIKHISQRGIGIIMGLPIPMFPEDITARPWDWERDNRRNAEACASLARWLRCYCEEKGIPVADFRSVFLCPDGSVRRDLLQDGIHPTEEGHRLMADVLCKLLDRADCEGER